jgi:beta-mannosidase
VNEIPLADGWHVSASPAGSARPDGAWTPTTVPATAAAALRAAGTWSIEHPPRRFDAEDWWWRTRFARPDRDGEWDLGLDGIATVADVWLNGVRVLSSTSMFVARRLPVELVEDNELVIHCRALEPLLAARRPRPRWRVPMIEQQQLRWFRTTLLGRTPGWSPPAAAVGPWLPVRLLRRGFVPARLRVRVDGTTGIVETSARGELVIERDGVEHRGRGRVAIPDVVRWWPHTHGEPALYRARLVGADAVTELGAVGFREITIDRKDSFAIRVNGVPIFCRGACWTPLDPVALRADRVALASALAQARHAGMNMLRVSGTTVYESADFHDLADELGILVWQDFMFANMDYPGDDPAFADSVAEEVRQVLSALQAHPSLAVLCGNSEVEQQAAMSGAARDRWSPRLFHETLPALCREVCPDVPYWPSSAHGGAAFPHQADAGTTSYYGVGAYLRPLEDARRAEVRFASECLAFANVPTHIPPALRVHHAAWKARTPRDLGAGWDFDDVRDHYVARLFGVNPLELRYADHERYLALGRVATGEVMAAVFGEWRRARSTCRGGLVWFLRDLWPGAGWGVVDAAGQPKAAYHHLRRALAPVAVHISDEGGNGLVVHVINDGPAPLVATIEVGLYRAREVPVGRGERAVEVAPHGAIELPASALFEGFVDAGWAYRFGPPGCDLVVATLRAVPDRIAQAFHHPLGLPATREGELGVIAEARPSAVGGDFDLTVRARRFAQSVEVDVDGFVPDDDYFHVAPGGQRTVRLRRRAAAGPPKGTVRPLNADIATEIALP